MKEMNFDQEVPQKTSRSSGDVVTTMARDEEAECYESELILGENKSFDTFS